MDKKTRHRILLVEDELFIRELYQRVLVQSGFEVIPAADGLVGLELAYKNPDLILLDIMLPGINGIEILKRLKKDELTKDIPIILLSNLGQENIIQEALRSGAVEYLMKIRLTPYDIVDRVKFFLADQ